MSELVIAPTLHVSLVQTSLYWHDAAANHRHFEQLLTAVAGKTDLIVLPEMFTTGFTMAAAAVAEPVGGPTTDWMRAVAARTNAVVTGSVVTRDSDDYFNRLLWMRPDGSYETYDKRHLFRMAREHEHYSAGNRPLTVTLNGWKLRPLVCYDLRFPVWSRNLIGSQRGYDVLLYVANWPERRRHAWQTLLKARAIENLSYCIGVNRTGTDAGGIVYSGDSAAIDFLGQALTDPSEAEFVATVTLDHAALTAFREKFPAHLDADRFELGA
jgi:predicted amidohydrolase